MTINEKEIERIIKLFREMFNQGWENAKEWDDFRDYTSPKLDELYKKEKTLSYDNPEDAEELEKIDELKFNEFDYLYDLSEAAKEKEWEKIWPDIWKVCEWEIERYAEGGAEEELMDSSYEAGWWHAKMWLRSLSDKKEK